MRKPTPFQAWAFGLGILALYEFYALEDNDQTLSDSVWAVSSKYPLIPFLSGLLAGHFYWQRAR